MCRGEKFWHVARMRGLGLTSFVVFSAVTVAALADDAVAQPSREAEAELLFKQGRAEMAKQNYAVACTKLRGSYELAPRPTTLMNLAACLEADRRLVSAWYAFTEAGKATGADAATAVAAQERANRLEPRLSKLTIMVASEARVPNLQITRDGEPVVEGQWNSEVYVDGGEYVIVARADGTDAWTARISVASELASERVVIPTLRRADAEPPVHPEVAVGAGAPPTVASTAPTVAAPADRGGLTAMRKVAVGGGVLGIVALGAGVYFGLDARSKEADADALCPGTTCSGTDGEAALRLNDEAQTSAERANLLYIGGGALVIASVGLWVLGAPPSTGAHGVSIAPTVTPTTSAVVVSGWF